MLPGLDPPRRSSSAARSARIVASPPMVVGARGPGAVGDDNASVCIGCVDGDAYVAFGHRAGDRAVLVAVETSSSAKKKRMRHFLCEVYICHWC